MGVEGKERGIRTEHRARGGVDFPQFLGKDSQRPSSLIADAALTEAINCRLVGNKVIARPGQQKLNSSAYGTVIGGLYDASDVGMDDDSEVAEFTTCTAGPGSASGPRLFLYNTALTRVVTYDQTNLLVTLPTVVSVGELWADPTLNRVIVAGDADVRTVTQDGTVATLFSISGVANFNNALRPMRVTGGDLYVHAACFAGTDKLVRWDGAIANVEDPYPAGALGVGPILADYAGKLHMVYYDTTGVLGTVLVRRDGPATFTVLHTFSSGNVFGGVPGTWAVYDGKLWFSLLDGSFHALYSWNGSAVALEHTLAFGDYAQHLYVRNGHLYYVTVATGFTPCFIGRYDGATFNDTFKAFADESTAAVRVIAEADTGEVYALCNTLGGERHIFQCNDPADLSGAWTRRGITSDCIAPTQVFTYHSMVGL